MAAGAGPPPAAWGWPHWLAALLALALIGAGLWPLLQATRGLAVERTEIGGVPVTTFVDPARMPAPVVVIGHGFAGSQQLMLPFALSLARAGYLAVTFDFPGHGRHRAPLRGELGSPERVASLLTTLTSVADQARRLPGSDGRLALLGHSMAADIQVRYALAHPQVAALIAVSPYLSQTPDASGPANLLLIYGALEPALLLDQGRAAVAAVTADLTPEAVEPAVTYGEPADGSARRLVIVPGVEHISVLYSGGSLAAARAWLDDLFARPGNGPLDLRGPWLGLYFLGVGLLAWPLSRLLPVAAWPPLGAADGRLGRGRFALLALLPPLLTPLLLRPLPTDFLGIIIGDYLALHFALYGALTWAGLWLLGQRPRLTDTRWWALVLGILLVGAFTTLALLLPADRFIASFLPGPQRLLTVLVLFAGSLLWTSADEWLTRGPRPPRLGYPLTKLLFLASLLLAVVLDLNQLFFLVIIIPAILLLFLLFGLFSRWLYRRSGHPGLAAVTNAYAFAVAVAVSFPLSA
ncbi:MAG: alpha/beta fold hydrolase [Chromatiaceae bacterium]|nr:MAG: alpha/beta fold hydrolase [Chromatiaceae bacterium]